MKNKNIKILFWILTILVVLPLLVNANPYANYKTPESFLGQTSNKISKPSKILTGIEIIRNPSYVLEAYEGHPLAPDYHFKFTYEGCIELAWNLMNGGALKREGQTTTYKEKLMWESITGDFVYGGEVYTHELLGSYFWKSHTTCRDYPDVHMYLSFRTNTFYVLNDYVDQFFELNKDLHPLFFYLKKASDIMSMKSHLEYSPEDKTKYYEEFLKKYDYSDEFLEYIKFDSEVYNRVKNVWESLKNDPDFKKENCKESFKDVQKAFEKNEVHFNKKIEEYTRLQNKCEDENDLETLIKIRMSEAALYRDSGHLEKANNKFILTSAFANEKGFNDLAQESYAMYLTTLYELGWYEEFIKYRGALDKDYKTSFLEEKETMFCVLNYADFDIRFTEFKKNNPEATRKNYDPYISELKDIRSQCKAMNNVLSTNEVLSAKTLMDIAFIYRKLGISGNDNYFLKAYKEYNDMGFEFLAQPAYREYLIDIYNGPNRARFEEFLEKYDDVLEEEYKTKHTEDIKKRIENMYARREAKTDESEDKYLAALYEANEKVDSDKYNILIINDHTKNQDEFNKTAERVIKDFFFSISHEALAQKKYQDRFNFVVLNFSFPKDYYNTEAPTGFEKDLCYEVGIKNPNALIYDTCGCDGEFTLKMIRKTDFDKFLILSDSGCRPKTWSDYAISAEYRNLISTAVHEMGHLLFYLADEYEQPGDNLFPSHSENCMYGLENAQEEWGDLAYEKIGSPVPLEGLHPEHKKALRVGFYTYCSWNKNNYKPTINSVMSNSDVFKDENIPYAWGPVNDRQIRNVLEDYE